MGLVVYIDGQFVPKEEASISVFDHGLLYGDGVFEGIRAYSGRVFRLDEHLKRLYDSAKAIALTVPIPPEEMRERVCETLRRNQLTDAYIRLVATRGGGDLGLDPRKCAKPTVIIITDTIRLYPAEVYQNGIELVTLATRRSRPDALSPRVKSLNYLNSIIGKIEAIRQGYDEGIMLNDAGFVAECTGDNIFLVARGSLLTPPTHAGILRGVTRDAVLECAQELRIATEEALFTLFDVYSADECFLTGTAAEIVPVVKVDEREIGTGRPGTMTRQLQGAFKRLIQQEGMPIYAEAAAS
jgi:branched-chain amino acid aminotransferase